MPLPDVLLRPCTDDDLAALEAWAPTGNSRTHEQRFARQRAGTSTFYLAALRDDPTSFVGSAEVRWDGGLDPVLPRCPETNGLQVWPEEARSRGIGTAMLSLLETEARRRGHRLLGLGVDDSGPKRLYLRCGYRDTGPDYVDRYTLIDEHHREHHREHHVADPARWMTKDLYEGRFVIGIDAGGTHTRVGCYDLDGRLLGSATGGGGGPHHNDDARENVRGTLAAALRSASLDASAATALVAGMAGVSREGSNQGGDDDLVADFFEIDGLACPVTVLNDAVIAHRGALSGRAGIVVVAGTGSMLLAIDEEGVETESGQLEHYAGAARHLVFDVVQRLLVGDADPGDPLYAEVLEHFGAADVPALREGVLARSAADRNDTKRAYGSFAPRVTALAEESPLADLALTDLAARTARGVRLLAPFAGPAPVPVACTGSLAADPAFRRRLERLLGEAAPEAIALVPPRLDPRAGAALLALEAAGIAPEGPVLDRLLHTDTPTPDGAAR
ncbi:GNAT family N-acetyltransferase [Brachybacterium sp. AOP43-C2-M15]|uniref:GNAT family N-acetyltransferase n=1 Tax=Brachybacterium sp. AOP43-C2-M15 TaxID=3457661 RepID=UPI004034CA8F